ncbi:MAG: hypothetical protein ACQKBY_11985 [Verrucomicrobiales bacterium]
MKSSKCIAIGGIFIIASYLAQAIGMSIAQANQAIAASHLEEGDRTDPEALKRSIASLAQELDNTQNIILTSVVSSFLQICGIAFPVFGIYRLAKMIEASQSS